MFSKIKKYVKLLFVKKESIRVPLMYGKILENKNIFITGGGSGIGYEIAKACLLNNANVVICVRNISKLEEAKRGLCSDNESLVENIMDKIIICQFDIASYSNLKNVLKEINEKHNIKIDCLINNAGVASKTVVGNSSENDYDNVMNVNLKYTYFMCQEFSNYLIEQKIKGNILNISSSSGARPAISPYMVSKWGIVGLTQGLAKKLIKYGIVVNGIAPGPTASGMLKIDNNDLYLESSPSKRYCDGSEIGNLAVYLISDMAKMIVGETIFITGGCGTLTKDDIYY